MRQQLSSVRATHKAQAVSTEWKWSKENGGVTERAAKSLGVRLWRRDGREWHVCAVRMVRRLSRSLLN